MPITILDSKSALVLIDLQKGIVAIPPPEVATEVISKSAQLAAAFRSHNEPVVLVNVAAAAPGRTDRPRATHAFPADWTDLVPELDQQPSDILITKRAYGAFLGTTLDQQLRDLGVTQIVLAGVATSIGVESTARSAYDLGYNVVFLTDAMADLDPVNHAHSIEKIFPRLGESGSTADLLALLN
jgi:nicotinamidase-related amidase